MSMFNDISGATLRTETREPFVVTKLVTKEINAVLADGDNIVITINGEDVINTTIPANKRVILKIRAQIEDV